MSSSDAEDPSNARSIPPDPLLSVVRALHTEVVQQLDLVQQIKHPGEAGRAREDIIRRFLRRFVPAGIGIDTGFVVDMHGGISKQIDIVLYRNDYHPVLEIGGVKYFLVESVEAVIQVKAVLDSHAKLEAALDNIRSVKQLDRSGGGNNYVVIDRALGYRKGSVPAVWGAVIAERSVSVNGFLSVFQKQLTAPRDVWIDCYVALNEFCARYSSKAREIAYKMGDADALVITDAAKGEPPLVDFMFLLSHRLRHAGVVDYDPGRYFPTSTAHQAWISVPAAAATTATSDVPEVP